MYKVDIENKTLSGIREVSFEEMKVEERKDIQQWIKNNPAVLGEELLIIQEEFSDFKDTDERFDLLALDKNGNLVIVENKRDESGKDVHWQAIKYASYCSTLRKDQIIEIYQKYLDKQVNTDCNNSVDAESNITEFLNNNSAVYPSNTQRIIMVARSFSKEVLSASQWLLNNGINISCVQLKPYYLDGVYLLDSDIILPQKELKEYLIKMADKNHDQQMQQKNNDEKSILYQDFWNEFSKVFDKKKTPFENITSWSTNKVNWIKATANLGVSGVSYQLVANNHEFRMELYIESLKSNTYHREIFDFFNKYKEDIEKYIGKAQWIKGDESKHHSKIFINAKEYSLYDNKDWNKIFSFYMETLPKFVTAFNVYKNKIPKPTVSE